MDDLRKTLQTKGASGLRACLRDIMSQIKAFECGFSESENPQLTVLLRLLNSTAASAGAFDQEKERGRTSPFASIGTSDLREHHELVTEHERQLVETLTNLKQRVDSFERFGRDNLDLQVLCGNIKTILYDAKMNSKSKEEEEFSHFSLQRQKHTEEDIDNLVRVDSSSAVSTSAVCQLDRSRAQAPRSVIPSCLVPLSDVQPRKKPKFNRCNHCRKLSLVVGSGCVDTSDDTPPEQQVFNNEMLLEMILENLSISELKGARQINQMWKKSCTKLLLKHQHLILSIYYPGCGGDHTVERRGDGANQPLTALNDSLRTSILTFGEGTMPVSSVLLKEPNLDATDIQHFFALLGQEVKSLKLQLLEETPISAFKLLLVFQTPCIKHLHLENIPLKWTTRAVELFPEPAEFRGIIQLTHLRSLTLGDRCVVSPVVVLDLLRVCINIQEFKGFREEFIDSFVNSNKVHAIKELTFQPQYSEESRQLYRKLGNSNMKIKRLFLYLRSIYDKPDTWPIFETSLSQVLHSSAEILEEMTVQPFGFLNGCKIPKLQRVKKLDIKVVYDKYNWRKIFPHGLKLTEAFPQLVSFKMYIRREIPEDIEGLNNGRATFYEYFEDSCPHENVQFLELHYLNHFVLPVFWTEKLTTMFPYLKEACFGRIANFPLVAKSMWRLKSLRRLQISLEVNESSTFGNQSGLDMAFTGFSHTKYIELKSQHLNFVDDTDNTDADPQGFREFSSIVDLKHLEVLDLQLYDCFDQTHSPYEPILSSLTGMAFRACPALKVNISVRPRNPRNTADFKEALEAVLPYIHTGP